MSRILIRQEPTDPDMRAPNRGVCLLDDGSCVALVVSAQETGVWRLMHSVDRSNWTIAFEGSTIHPRYTSMTIDSGNGIHITYQKIGDATRAVYYRNFTKGAGYTWSAGTERTVATPTGTNVFAKRDVEIFPTGAVIVTVLHRDESTSPSQSSFRLYTMPGGGSTFTLKYSSAGVPNGSITRACSVARSLAAPVGTVNNAMMAYDVGSTVATSFRSFTFDTSSGNISSNTEIYAMAPDAGYDYTYGHLFSTAINEWVFGGAIGHNSGATGQEALAIKFNMASMLAKATLPKYDYTGADADTTYPSACMMGNGRVVLLSPWRTGVVAENGIQATVCTIVGNTLTWGTPFVYQQDLGFEFIRSGANRNFSSTFCDVASCRTYDQTHHAVKLDTPQAPVAVGPSTSQSTAVPTLSATLSVGQGRVRASWRIATNSGFTGAVKTITDPISDLVTSGTTFEQLDSANALSTGTWYVDAETLTEFGTTSPWSTTSSFTVAHAPTTTGWYPQGGISVPSSVGGGFTFTWQFSDPYPSDSQTAYRIEVLDVSNTVLYDTGKVTSSTPSHTITNQLDAYTGQSLHWTVMVWDQEDTPSVTWSADQLFKVYSAPIVNITAPTGTIDNPNPTITWSFSTGDARTQKYYKISIQDLDTLTYVLQSPLYIGTATSFTPDNVNLFNATNYRYSVTVTDSVGLTATDTSDVLTSWVPPMYPPFTVDTLNSPTTGNAVVAWDNSVKATGFIGYRVYRRLMGSTYEQLIYETTSDLVNYEFTDWIAPSNAYQEWSVVQVVNRFGSEVESIRQWTADVIANDYYWLLHPTDSSKHIRLDGVTAESMSDDQEEEIMTVINRGRHKDVGTYLGYSGSLTVQVWGSETQSAREMKLQFELLRRENTVLFLRNPFGDLYQVASGVVTIDRLAGVGTRELHTVNIPYVSVGTPINVGVLGELNSRRGYDIIYGGDDAPSTIFGG
jgi:hypothetical protein